MRTSVGILLSVLAAGCSPEASPEIGESVEMILISGNAQSAVVGHELASPVVVQVTDAKGKPVYGVLVNFRIASGGGTTYAGSALTDATGYARERWTLGTQAGPQSLEARALSPTGAPLSYGLFKANARPDAATSLVARTPALTDGLAGQALSPSPAVQLADKYGNAVASAGVAVTFAVSSGGGSVSGAAAVTDGTGAAAVGSWTLGVGTNGQGKNTLDASASGLTGVTFTATGRQSPATLTLLAGDGQQLLPDDSGVLPVHPRIRITDQFGNAVEGYAVTFTVTSGDSSLDGGVTTRTIPTDYDGTASTGWTIGQTNGANTLTASAGATNPSQVTFHALRATEVGVSPGQYDFGSVIGKSAPLTITLTNRGSRTLSCNKFYTLPTNVTQTLNTCGPLLPYQTCTVQLTYQPQVAGPTSGTYLPQCNVRDANNILTNEITTIESATLSGVGIPEVAVSPSHIDFGTGWISEYNGPVTVTLTNRGSRLLQCNKSWTISTGFVEQSNDCFAIANGETCHVTLAFAPQSMGTTTGTYQPDCFSRDGVGGTYNPLTESASLTGEGMFRPLF